MGGRTICLYFAGRAHAGENLDELLKQREADRAQPLVMSDAQSNNAAMEAEVIRCNCLVHGHRKFMELEGDFPEECRQVIDWLRKVFENEETSRAEGLDADERLVYHQQHSGPIMAQLKIWLKKQFEDREVEPNSSLGKAFQYLLNHWEELTRFLETPGAPLDNNTVERTLKLIIRQRKNSLFYANAHGAYVASLLTSLIATCVQAGVNALEYLVALQEHRSEVSRNPADWLPWNYQDNPAMS